MIGQRNWKPAIAILILCLFQWALLFWDVNPTWDAAFYYAYTRSIVFDNDLIIENDLKLSYSSASQDFATRGLDEVRTITGRVATPFALGSALTWAPWLAILRLAAGAGNKVGLWSAQMTGYEWYFTISIATLSAVFGWVAYWISYLIARDETGRFSSLAAVLTMLLATPLLYYQSREPLYAHATSAFVIAVAVYVWWRSYLSKPSYGQGLLLGGLIGLAGLVRSQHLVFLILPAVSAAWWWFALPASKRRGDWQRPVIYLALASFAAMLLFSIQMAHWHSLFGQWLTVPQGPGFMDWRARNLLPLLFSTFRGVLTWMPVAFLSVIGLVIIGRNKPRLSVPLLLVLLAVIYVNSSTKDWFSGGGFGPRRFSGELVIFVLGYAGLLQMIPSRLRKPLAIIVGVFLFLHQWILLRYGLIEKMGGRVLSMHPNFDWADDSYWAFSRQLLSHLPDIFISPTDFFVFNLSPVDRILNQTWPTAQILTLFFTAAFVFLAYLALQWIRRRFVASANGYRALVVSGVVAVLLIDLWILFRA